MKTYVQISSACVKIWVAHVPVIPALEGTGRWIHSARWLAA